MQGRPRKRARRDPRNQFLDVEAEVDEEDEGDEEDDEDLGDTFIAETHPDDLVDLPEGTDTDDKGHRWVHPEFFSPNKNLISCFEICYGMLLRLTLDVL